MAKAAKKQTTVAESKLREELLRDVIGAVDGPPDGSKDTGKAFTEVLLKKHAAERRRSLP